MPRRSRLSEGDKDHIAVRPAQRTKAHKSRRVRSTRTNACDRGAAARQNTVIKARDMATEWPELTPNGNTRNTAMRKPVRRNSLTCFVPAGMCRSPLFIFFQARIIPASRISMNKPSSGPWICRYQRPAPPPSGPSPSDGRKAGVADTVLLLRSGQLTEAASGSAFPLLCRRR